MLYPTLWLRYRLQGKQFLERKDWDEETVQEFISDRKTVTIADQQSGITLGGLEQRLGHDDAGEEAPGTDAADDLRETFHTAATYTHSLDMIDGDDGYEFCLDVWYRKSADHTDDFLFASQPEGFLQMTGSIATEDLDAYLQQFEPAVRTDGGSSAYAVENDPDTTGVSAGWTQRAAETVRGVYDTLTVETQEEPVSVETAEELIAHSRNTVRMELPVYVLSPPLKKQEQGWLDWGSPRTVENGRPLHRQRNRQGYRYVVEDDGIAKSGRTSDDRSSDTANGHRSTSRGPKFDPDDAAVFLQDLDDMYAFEELTVADIGSPRQYRIDAVIDETVEWGNEEIAVDETVTYKGRLARGYAESVEAVLDA